MSETSVNTSKELDLLKKVKVKNVSNVDCYFRAIETMGDHKVAKKSEVLFTIGEIMAQIYVGNPSFIGVDGKGSHADLYIMDRQVRVEAGFESEDGKVTQEVVDEKAIIELFKIDKLDVFAETLKSKVQTIGEKQTLRDVIASDKVNEHDRIQIAGKYLRGEPIDIPKRNPGRPKKND